ncbi:hypothetical protein BGZ49_001917, partial [Haplosporangium sp. Z 27]
MSTKTAALQGDQCQEENVISHCPPSVLIHKDSELTIIDEHKPPLSGEKDIDVEHASATIDSQEPPTLVDGPIYGWVV